MGNAGGSGAQSQAKATFVYGGGADYELTRRFTLRAEYRGFVYKRPDFDLATTRLRCEHQHRPALCRYRLSLLTNDTVLVATGSGFPRRDPRRGDVGLIYTEFESNSSSKGEGSRMTLKSKRNVTLEHDVSPIQPHAQDTSANHAPSHEEIRRRAYEIYLERDGLPGDALDDWLRAERELQKVAVFKRAWNRLEQRDRPDSEDGN